MLFDANTVRKNTVCRAIIGSGFRLSSEIKKFGLEWPCLQEVM